MDAAQLFAAILAAQNASQGANNAGNRTQSTANARESRLPPLQLDTNQSQIRAKSPAQHRSPSQAGPRYRFLFLALCPSLTFRHTSRSSGLPVQTSNRDNRRADRVVAAEEALAKTDGPQASKAAKALSTCKGKGKGKQVEAHPAQKDATDNEESDSDEEALRLAPIEPTEPPKGKKRKVAEATKEPEPADDIQEPATKKQKPRPKMHLRSSAIPISSDGTIDIASSSTAVSPDAPDAPAATAPLISSKVVSIKKALVPAKSAGVKGTRATTRATTRAKA
ncbi:hypothetical protein FS749_005989 [Ceratobasidium sp. UAMH 11750]|nr:hypothetical protein FS749_005989 [Ceratobasidium sp. UAMH 11750]